MELTYTQWPSMNEFAITSVGDLRALLTILPFATYSRRTFPLVSFHLSLFFIFVSFVFFFFVFASSLLIHSRSALLQMPDVTIHVYTALA